MIDQGIFWLRIRKSAWSVQPSSLRLLSAQTNPPVLWHGAWIMVKAARAEACGKSVMCRDGLWQLQLMLEGIINGQSNADDLDVMKETLVAMKTVGCPNTQKVATLILTSLEQNAEEWDLHVRRHRCTALKCYYSLYIDPAVCKGNGACLKAVPCRCSGWR